MYIIAGGMQRSASTLQYQIAKHLVEEDGLGSGLGWFSPTEQDTLEERSDAATSYLLFKSHAVTPFIKRQFSSNNAVGLYIYRDVRDIASSLKEKNRLQFTEASLSGLVKSIIETHRKWMQLEPLYISTYERCMHNLPQEIAGIAAFLGVSLSAERLDAMAAQYSMAAQKQKINQLQHSTTLVVANHTNVYDPDSLLHLNHISTGEIGRHRRNLSEAETSLVERLVMASGYSVLISSEAA